MKLIHRRFIYLSFIAAFLIITPIIIIYTSGYRYNFKRGTLEKTGIIYLESTPRSAKIYLNGAFLDYTPARLTDLLPDKYSVEVSKDGYYPWRKTIEVRSNFTAFEKNIILFKQSQPTWVVPGEINILSVSPNQDIIFYSLVTADGEEIHLLNINNGSDYLVKTLPLKSLEKISFIDWSPNQAKALLKKTAGSINKYFVVNLETMAVIELDSFTTQNFDQLDWDAADTSFLYALGKTGLYRLDLAGRKAGLILQDSIVTFRVSGSIIYYVSQVQNDYYLNRRSLANFEAVKSEKIKLPASPNYRLLDGSQSYIILSDSGNSDFYVIDLAVFSDLNKENFNMTDYVAFQDKAYRIKWSADFRQLLYFTDFDIYVFDFFGRQKYLVTRYGETIEDAIWYPENNYLIYQVGGTIHTTEICCADLKNDITLADNAENANLIIDSAGKYLYFAAKIGDQEGLYKLQLQ